MNYIHRLQKELAEAQATVRAHEHTLTDLRVYLSSDKFESDPTVQTRDVMYRLDSGLNHFMRAEGV